MPEFHRVAIASRAFSLAAIVGLGLALDNLMAVRVAIVVAAIAAVAAYLATVSPLPEHWVIGGEAGLASLIVALTLPDSLLLLPYLVALPLVAGLARGLGGAGLAIGLQLGAMLLLILTSEGITGLSTRTEQLAPWSLTIIGSGLLGAWIKKIGKAPSSGGQDDSYEAARRLLAQLRGLARRLSSGLDPVAVATEMLTTVEGQVGASRSAVLTKNQGGVFSPLAYHGPHAGELLDPDDPIVEECWRERQVRRATRQGPDGATAHTTALPLRLGSQMAGVLMLSTPSPADEASLSAVRHQLDELSLRLETALAFEEVRHLVTADERQRLAREIHDGVAQEIASLGYVVDEIGAMTTDPDLGEALSELRGELSRVVTELRLSIFDLRTGVADGSGLGSALSDYVRTVGAKTPITVHLTLDEAPTRLTSGVETELFRIAQEAITNARKHSGAENLWVDCRVQPPTARVEIRDDGKGLGKPRHDSYGLRMMRERAQRIGASLAITGNNDARPGTCVTVVLGDSEDASHEEAGTSR